MYPTIHAALLISKTLQSATGNSKQYVSACQMETLRFLSLCREGLPETCHPPKADRSRGLLPYLKIDRLLNAINKGKPIR